MDKNINTTTRENFSIQIIMIHKLGLTLETDSQKANICLISHILSFQLQGHFIKLDKNNTTTKRIMNKVTKKDSEINNF